MALSDPDLDALASRLAKDVGDQIADQLGKRPEALPADELSRRLEAIEHRLTDPDHWRHLVAKALPEGHDSDHRWTAIQRTTARQFRARLSDLVWGLVKWAAVGAVGFGLALMWSGTLDALRLLLIQTGP